MNVELANLRAFVAVAELGSFHAAANALHLSSPALSRRISNLERAVGAKLFDRTTRHVSLTLIGRELSIKARQLLNQVDNALLGIRDFTEGWQSEVVVACVPSAVDYFLPDVLLRFRQRFPKIRVRIFDEGASEGLSRVIRGEAEFGLNFVGIDQPEIVFEPIFEERFVVICRRDDALAKKRKVSWVELSTQPLIAVSRSSGSGIRLMLDLALAESAQQMDWIYEVRHISLLPVLVEAGLGVAVVPRLALPTSHREILAAVPLVDPIVTRTLGLMKRRGRSLSPAAEQLYAMIRDVRHDRTRMEPNGNGFRGNRAIRKA